MKCVIPEISYHNRDPVLSLDFQVEFILLDFQSTAPLLPTIWMLIFKQSFFLRHCKTKKFADISVNIFKKSTFFINQPSGISCTPLRPKKNFGFHVIFYIKNNDNELIKMIRKMENVKKNIQIICYLVDSEGWGSA